MYLTLDTEIFFFSLIRENVGIIKTLHVAKMHIGNWKKMDSLVELCGRISHVFNGRKILR